MCGFAGFIGPDTPSDPADRRALLHRMGQQLRRRGPDDEQVYDDGQLAFVFRRLAIIDLATGTQPIWNADKSRFVAVNGEIYNHLELRERLRGAPHFRTRSDAEVVLHLYEERGPAAVEQLIGKFALLIWDAPGRRLFLARDRLGIKPLYYVQVGDLFLFGSELKALLVHPDCPRQPAFGDLGAPIRGDRLHSFVERVEQLPGGRHATYEGGRLRTSTYWSVDAFFRPPEEPGRSADEYADAYAALFTDSVARRLMSDVPLGGFLSGGLDSTLVMAAAARSRPGLPAFHVLERTTFLSGDANAARRAADELDLDLHQVLFDHRTLVAELGFDLAAFEYFVWLLDSPHFEIEWFLKHELHRYAKTVVPDLKVILLGQGADEFAGGYSRAYGGPSEGSWKGFLRASRSVARGDEISSLHAADWMLPLLSDAAAPFSPADFDFHDEMRRRTVMLQNFNLWHEDRTAAGQGIEARVPFLDHRLVELLASIPPRLHAELFLDKKLVRDVGARLLPEDLVRRPKVGFYNAYDTSSIATIRADILRRVYPDFEEKYLDDDEALFAREPVRGLFERVGQGGAGAHVAAARLFTVMATAVFARMCREMPRGWQPAGIDPPSPLRACAQPPVAWGPAVDRAGPDWSLDVLVEVEPGVEFCQPISPAAGRRELLVLRDGVREEHLELEDDLAFVERVVRMLTDAAGPVVARNISRTCQASEDELGDVLTFLAGRGWVVLRDAPRAINPS